MKILLLGLIALMSVSAFADECGHVTTIQSTHDGAIIQINKGKAIHLNGHSAATLAIQAKMNNVSVCVDSNGTVYIVD